MHYALRASYAPHLSADGKYRTKQRRNHHAQSKVPRDANGQFPCLRKCVRSASLCSRATSTP